MPSRLTIKRLDPWSVLKFGAVANLALLAIFMLIAGVVWFIIDRLALVDQACSIAADIGFTTCGVNAGNLFRALALLGLLGVVVQTAVLVFFAFLHNLIADLTGGLVIGVIEEPGARREPRRVTTAATPPARQQAPAMTAGPAGAARAPAGPGGPGAGTPGATSSPGAAGSPGSPRPAVSDGRPASSQRSASQAGDDSLFGTR